MGNAEEIVRACKEIGVLCKVMDENTSKNYIKDIKERFSPLKLSGHLSLDNPDYVISIDKYEFSYSLHLEDEPIYMFFDQENHNKEKVVVVDDGRPVCKVLENAFGMEYFLSNAEKDYLIAVNWYSIQGVGTLGAWEKHFS